MKIGNIGNKLDLQFRQGSTFGPYQLTLKNSDGTLVDLTSCVLSGNIRKNATLAPISTSLVFSITDPISGIVSMSIPKENTALLKGNSDFNTEYAYDIVIQFADGHIEPLFYGDVYVKNLI